VKSLLTKVAAIIVVVTVLTAVAFCFDPEGFENYLIDNDTKINIDMDGRLHRQEAVFEHLAEGVNVEDRSFLAKKARLLHLLRMQDSKLALEVSEFGKAMVQASEDKTLDTVEVTLLKDINSDLVSKDDVANWYNLAREMAENVDYSQENKVILITNH
jgi:hypothetical protein